MDQLPDHLPCPPDQILARLARQGLVIHSVWFPTQVELDRWNDSGVPVYVRPLSAASIEVGPRLGAMWASVFSPVHAITLTPDAHGTSLTSTTRFTRVTTTVLTLWALLLTGWGVGIFWRSDIGLILWWTILAAATVAAPIVGWRRGGQALQGGIPWLSEVLLAEDDEEDW